MIPTEHVLALATALFGLGGVGVLLRRHWIVMLVSLQLMLAAVQLLLVGFDAVWQARLDAAPGQILALLALGVGAAQLALGLAIMVAAARGRGSLDASNARLLRW